MKFDLGKSKGVQDIKPYKVEPVISSGENPTMQQSAFYSVNGENVKKTHNVGPSKKANKSDKAGKSLRYFKKLRGIWNHL